MHVPGLCKYRPFTTESGSCVVVRTISMCRTGLGNGLPNNALFLVESVVGTSIVIYHAAICSSDDGIRVVINPSWSIILYNSGPIGRQLLLVLFYVSTTASSTMQTLFTQAWSFLHLPA